MMRVIQNLLEISKIEEGKMPLTCEPLAEVVQDVTTEYQAMVLETGKRLVVSVDTAVPARSPTWRSCGAYWRISS